MCKIGFDNQKYLELQSKHIRERIAQFGDKLYLEFGGKLFDDYHASRVLPGFAPDSKLQMLLQLKDDAEVVIVINAAKVVLTGKKLEQKKYYRYSGYVGGLKETSAKDMLEKKPELMVYEAIKGMMPKNSLGRNMLTKLRVYSGAEHEHAAQKPETYTI